MSVRPLFLDFPVGEFEFVEESDSSVLYAKWAPGNCTAYRIFVTSLPRSTARENGGNRLITFGFHDNFVGIVLCRDIGLCHISYFMEKVGEKIKSDVDKLFFCALLNLVVFENMEYANECIEVARRLSGSLRLESSVS